MQKFSMNTAVNKSKDSKAHEPVTRPGHVLTWLDKGLLSASGPAVQFSGRAWSYAELESSSNRIAHYLIYGGLVPGDRVGVCLDRSFEMVAVMVGILKTGAAYVPLDPSYPNERLSMMAAAAGWKRVIVHKRYGARVRSGSVWEEIIDEINTKPSNRPDVEMDPENPAYIMFTSGSTGTPKGVVMPHSALSNLIEWQLSRSGFVPGARVLQYSSISFDVSFQEIATTIASGGTLFLITDSDRRDPRFLLNLLVQEKIERLFLPYVALRSLVDAALVSKHFPCNLREVITAGEQLRVDDALRAFFRELDGTALDNQYGPTETHVITAHMLSGDPGNWPDLPAIGKPIQNCSVLILDEQLVPVPDGETGELYLAGANLSLGYLGDLERTEERFIPHPHQVGSLVYKTGDLGRWDSEGCIQFLGRRDHQVKIRGHRVEPGEVNNTAAAFPGIGQCFTHAVGDGSDGTIRLALYYTVQETSIDQDALRRHLSAHLPEFMVPSFFVEIDEVPYTPSGKVDYRALPDPRSEGKDAASTVAYSSKTEEVLAGLWREVLGVHVVPRTADFFDLGGDSLRAVRLFLKIDQVFGEALPLSTLNYAATVESQASVIDGDILSGQLKGFRSLSMIQRGDGSTAPLFLVHGGEGNVLVFSRFASYLDERLPVYAFQWSGWDGFRGDHDVGKMAARYVEELNRFYPEGPVWLGGYCIGGMVALEMSRRLRDAGRRVLSPVVVWDAPNMESVHYHMHDEPWDCAENIARFESMKEQLAAVRLETSIEPGRAPATDYTAPVGRDAIIRRIPGMLPLLRLIKRSVQRAKQLPVRLIIIRCLLMRIPVPYELRVSYCRRAMLRAAIRHRSPVYSDDILYFRSDCLLGRYISMSGWWDDIYMGFAELTEGRFEAFAIGGAHTDVLDIPEMGAMVRERLSDFGG